MQKQRAPPTPLVDEELPGRLESSDSQKRLSPTAEEKVSPSSRFRLTVEREVMPGGIMADKGSVTPSAQMAQVVCETLLEQQMGHMDSQRTSGPPTASWGFRNTDGSSSTPVLKVVERTSSASDADLSDLWQAVIVGNVAAVERCLKDQQGHVDMWVQEDENIALCYKGRAFKAQPIHLAAAHGHAKVIELLVKNKAQVKSNASTRVDGTVRKCQPIHMAAGSGGRDALLRLLEEKADPNAEALFNNEMHYYPIHDAAFFNVTSCMKHLLEAKAKVDAENFNKETPLHVCARYGHLDCAEFILKIDTRGGKIIRHGGCDKHTQRLVTKRNKQGMTALELAVVRGQFPPRKLWIFTSCLDAKTCRDELIQAFMQVAKACPAAVPLILRAGEEEADLSSVPISTKWIDTFKEGGKKGHIRVHDLAVLVYEAPQAYVDLIEALSDKPKEENHEHHPLPIRVSLPWDSEACPMTCEYQEDDTWVWDNTSYEQRRWHNRFAEPDPKHGSEVIIKVVHLKGIADLELVYYLGIVPNLRVFTKLTTHALLKFMWSRLYIVYLVDLIHEVATVLVLSIWSTDERDQEYHRSETMRCVMWCIVASFGLTEGVFLIWCLFKLPYFLQERSAQRDGHGPKKSKWSLGRKAFETDLQFIWGWSHRIVLSCLTLGVAAATEKDLGATGERSIVLSTTILLHWILLLYRLRAFQWLGKRLLPVMKSVMPIVGMLIIMCFLGLGFFFAFWAMDRQNGDETLAYQVIILLFAGEPFYFEDSLKALDTAPRSYIIILTFLALLGFGCCTVNVFIAVLGDIYDQEQDRVVCTYLQERAKICTLLLLRPEVKILPRAQMADQSGFSIVWTILFTAIVMASASLCGSLVYAYSKVGLSIWLAAVVMAIGLVLIQGLLRAALTESWHEKLLWFCHEVRADEAEFLNASERSSQLHDGRLARIRKEVQCTGQHLNMIVTRINDRCKSIHRTITELGSPHLRGSGEERSPHNFHLPEGATHSFETGYTPPPEGHYSRSSTWGQLPVHGTTTAGSPEAAVMARHGFMPETPAGRFMPQTSDPQNGYETPAGHQLNHPPHPPTSTRELILEGGQHYVTAPYTAHSASLDSSVSFGGGGVQQVQQVALAGEPWSGLEAVASQLHHQLASMRQTMESLHSRMDKQDERHARVEEKCNQTVEKLQEILDKAARRRDHKRGHHRDNDQPAFTAPLSEGVTPPVSPLPGLAKRATEACRATDARAEEDAKVLRHAIPIEAKNEAAEGAPETATGVAEKSSAPTHSEPEAAACEELQRQTTPSDNNMETTPSFNPDAFSPDVGDVCESKDKNERWWPVRITEKFADGIYAVDVLDGMGTKWKSVKHIRPFYWEFTEGTKCEAKNKEEEWWPVTVIGRDKQNCTYEVVVHDDCHSQWSVVYSWNMRPLSQASEREEGASQNSNRPRAVDLS